MIRTNAESGRKRFGRRAIVAGLLLSACTLVGLTGCDKKEEKAAGGGTPAMAGDKGMTIGFIYVGTKDDYGYNQSHSEGAAMLKKIPGVKILEEEKVPETMDVQKTMASMASASSRSYWTRKSLFQTLFSPPPLISMRSKRLK